MGKDAQVRAVLAEGEDEGRLQYEPPRLLFRGRVRRAFDGDALKGVRADGAELVTADGSRFTLGEKAAASWAEAILNPKGRLDKLGVKAGQRIALLNLPDEAFGVELTARAGAMAQGSDLDILFYGADSPSEVAAIAGLIPRLAERGAIWVVSRKGAAAGVKDVDVFAAARPLGLVDTKVCSFSDTHTALRFVRRR
jgi:hypothetical protein